MRGIGKTYDSLGPSPFKQLATLETILVSESKASLTHPVYFETSSHGEGAAKGERIPTPVFEISRLEVGEEVRGPAVIIDDTQTIVVIPGAEAVVLSRVLVLKVPKV